MEIRPATPDDVPHVLPMVQQICAFHEQLDGAKYAFVENVERLYDGWLRTRATDPRSVFLVAQRDGAGLVGFLVGTAESEMRIYRTREYGFVHDVWVEPDYRNEGVARQMVMLAIEAFRAMGLPQVRLDVAAANDPALRLFAACSFRPSTTEMLLEL